MTGIYTRLIYLLLCFVPGFAVMSCNASKDKGSIPTYVHVDSFTFSALPPSLQHIATSHQINSVWAYYNNSPIGVFDLPADIPVLANGTGILTLRPGVSVSGLNNFLATYPFYLSDTSSLISQPGKTIHYSPTTTYYPSSRCTVIANFDSNLVTPFKVDAGAKIERVGGTGSVTLNAKDSLSEIGSIAQFAIPLGKDAYIEFDYKCTIPFSVGLKASLGTLYTKYYLAGIYPSDHWQKFYLSVKDFEAQYQATGYNFYIKTELPAGQSSGTVLIDNIQLVYFD